MDAFDAYFSHHLALSECTILARIDPRTASQRTAAAYSHQTLLRVLMASLDFYQTRYAAIATTMVLFPVHTLLLHALSNWKPLATGRRLPKLPALSSVHVFT
jgi:hypothetical protein